MNTYLLTLLVWIAWATCRRHSSALSQAPVKHKPVRCMALTVSTQSAVRCRTLAVSTVNRAGDSGHRNLPLISCSTNHWLSKTAFISISLWCDSHLFQLRMCQTDKATCVAPGGTYGPVPYLALEEACVLQRAVRFDQLFVRVAHVFVPQTGLLFSGDAEQ